MLTKRDLITLKTLFENTEKEIISKVGDAIQNNTDELVKLITTGFNTQEAHFDKIEQKLLNHEDRMGVLETECFKAN